MPLSLYIHIPFCEVKCGYCDFFSVPRGYGDFDLQKEYVQELLREIDKRASDFKGRSVRSLFFGGGTPSLLAPDLLEKIFKKLSQYFSLNPEVEVTLESNPKTVSYEKLKIFRSLGVNRISLGVQSFQDRFLQVMGRIHNGAEALRTIEDIHRAGFENYSFDLIYALPGQSFKDWQEDLERAISLGTPHLSAYHLTIEEGTSFHTLYEKGKLKLPEEEEGVRLLTWTRERLQRCQARLEPYEISNFSRPSFESVHNRNYWQYGEYLGFGAGAASFVKCSGDAMHRMVDGERRTNVRDLKKYLSGAWEGFCETIDLKTAMGEFCMLALRMREGIGEKAFEKEFHRPLQEVFLGQIVRMVQKGWLNKIDGGWCLTPQGLLFANDVAIAFL